MSHNDFGKASHVMTRTDAPSTTRIFCARTERSEALVSRVFRIRKSSASFRKGWERKDFSLLGRAEPRGTSCSRNGSIFRARTGPYKPFVGAGAARNLLDGMSRRRSLRLA